MKWFFSTRENSVFCLAVSYSVSWNVSEFRHYKNGSNLDSCKWCIYFLTWCDTRSSWCFFCHCGYLCIRARTLTLVSKEFIIWPTFAISAFIGIEVRFCETRLNFKLSPGGEGGTPGNSWWGCAAWFSKSRTLFQTRKSFFFHTRFQALPLKSIPARRVSS